MYNVDFSDLKKNYMVRYFLRYFETVFCVLEYRAFTIALILDQKQLIQKCNQRNCYRPLHFTGIFFSSFSSINKGMKASPEVTDSLQGHAESSSQTNTRPLGTSDIGHFGVETNVTNYDLMNPNIATTSGTRDIRHCLSSMPLNPESVKARFNNEQENEDLPKEQPSDQLMDSNINKRLKVSSSMNFSNFLFRQSRKGKGFLCKSSEISNEPNVAEMTNNKGFMGRMSSNGSLKLSEMTLDFPQESAYKGMNLRKWLKLNSIQVNKAERLQIYRQVVQVVDMTHSQGNALQDLWLSNFSLLPSNEIIYFDSSINYEVINSSQSNRKHIQQERESYSVTIELEKKWYASPEELYGMESLSANIYNLGVLLFELLSSFASLEMHSAAMLDLQYRILPPRFISQNPQESAFCLWLLHPHPSSRPTTREILQSELLSGTKEFYSKNTYSPIIDKTEDSDFEILFNFLVLLKEQKEKHALELYKNIQLLETDIKSFHHVYYDSKNIFETRMKTNMSHLESAYFSKRSQLQLCNSTTASNDRNDLDLLGNHERCCDDFLKGVCKFIRYSKFEECGNLKIGNLLNSANVICSLSFDRDENYIAVAGVLKKIKIFEFVSLLNDSVDDVNYPVVELVNDSKLSCVCWNKYLKNYLVSADYDGVLQVWDAFIGQGLSHYIEHQRRAWCVDFSRVDPTQFASGSDDCSVKLWSLNDKKSTCTIRSAANVCCVQFSPCSSHLLAFGSADYQIHCYDLRHVKIPWCTLAGHEKAVSYVKFLDSDSVVSASTDNTVKLWDLKKTSLEGISTDACCMTYKGHTNEKNFAGLSVLDGYIACGSESNEVYAYHKSFPMPITSYKFGTTDSISGGNNGEFVSSVCWREKSNMIVAANSGGHIKVLKML
ncbi:protein SPA1-RELATED 2 isoform X1 [Lactuca sativa]|uniref:Protein kinase domain-containing protein n=2 Tax=Lactuca sativa TaxID=4236 RepID=A0A9R1W2U3_LACSA|nr:protein SPA1-RELATED 2 isoform X1 [Lactuca sativa]XP_023757899.1 protein SPA1-RELATED 2 isoform X1 [Lactuca sativa]KAJ0214898.1 hypothetical protein LSAT_V11C300156030 [Lactuca sativa]